MSIWYKQGVIGDLNNECQKCLGRIHDHYQKDVYVTAIRDGNHMAGSLHYNGNAFDFRQASYITEPDLKQICGKDFDVVIHPSHIHIEYDPKGVK